MTQPANAAKAGGGGGRYYVWGTERYWSVTTILKALPKDALKYWAAGKVAEFAYDDAKNWLGMTRERAVDYLKREPMRFTGERADFGSALHAAAEALSLGRPLPPSALANVAERRAAAAYLAWAGRFKPTFVATEAQTFNRRQRYAGTFDNIVELDKGHLDELWPAHPWDSSDGKVVRLLGDYKTGGDVVERKGIYSEVALQLNAYAHGEFIGLPNGGEAPMPKLDGLFALHVGPGGYRMVPVVLDVAVFKAFLYVREVFRWLEVTSKDVIGPAFEDFAVADDLTEGAPA